MTDILPRPEGGAIEGHQLAGLHAVVTGATRGIGWAIAETLAGLGARLTLMGRNQTRLAERADAIGGGAAAIVCDVTDEASVEAAFAGAVEANGAVSVLINNAGVAGSAPFHRMETAHWREMLETNLTGAFLCTQEAFRLMRSQDPRGGRIINNGSVSAYVPRPNSAPYTATKHAISGLTRSTSLDGREYNIACGQIDIGNAETAMAEVFKTGVSQANGSIAPEPTMDTDNVARAVV